MDTRGDGKGAELNLLFRLTGDGSSFQSAVNSAKASAGGLSASLGKQFSGLGGAIAGAFSVGAIVNLARETIAFGGQITDLSERYGISTDMVQKLKFAAEQSGSSVESMLGGFKKMNLAMVDAMEGNEGKQDAFQRMGVSMDDLKSKSPEEVFRMIARAAKDMPHTPQLFADIKDVLGKSGDELLPAFKAGLDEAIASAERLGIVMSASSIAALDTIGDQFDVIKIKAMSYFAPVLESIAGIAHGFFDFIEIGTDMMAEQFGRLLVLAEQLINLDFKGAARTAADIIKGGTTIMQVTQVGEHLGTKRQERVEAAAAARIKKAREGGGGGAADAEEKASDAKELEKLRAANEAAALKRQPLDIQILEKKKALAAAEERMMAANAAALMGEGGAELAQEKALAEKIKIEGELTALKPKGDTAPIAAASQDALARIGGSRGGKSPIETISAQQLAVSQQLLVAIQAGNQNTAVLNP